jgi:hypothetical protein
MATACDYFFLLGWAKEEVHRSEPRTLDELEQQIRDTCAAVSLVLLKEKCESASCGLLKCAQNTGVCAEI